MNDLETYMPTSSPLYIYPNPEPTPSPTLLELQDRLSYIYILLILIMSSIIIFCIITNRKKGYKKITIIPEKELGVENNEDIVFRN